MINEKLLEILVINQVFKELEFNSKNREWVFGKNKIDMDKLTDRYVELVGEFLKPYVIDTISKEN